MSDGTTPRAASAGDAVTGEAGLPPQGSPPGPPCLLVTSAPHAAAIGRVFELTEGVACVIGRSQESALQIDDAGISRRHARVRCSGAGVYVLTDLRSSNGTFVNGRRVRRAALRQGDRIQLGTATVLRFSTRRRLDESDQRQRQALCTSGVGTWEWDVATRHLSFTGGAERLVRAGGGADVWLAVHPEDRQRLRDELSRSLVTGAVADVEARLVGEQGRVAWVSLRGELLRDERGEPLRIAGALVDVSVRKQAEQELRRQALIFECTSDAVFVVDRDGSILDWNPAASRLLGYARSEAVGRIPGELLEPGEAEPFHRAAAEAMACEGRWKGERTLRRKQGGPCHAEIEVVPLRDGASRHLADLVVLRDVGEQRRVQAQLLLADRLSAMGTLAAGVAHEINNPVAFVQANLDCLSRLLAEAGRYPPAELLRRAGDMVADASEGIGRIALIAQELKSYSRASAVAEQPRGSVARAVAYALRIAKAETARRARVVTDVGELPPVRLSEPQLGQVLVNLLINAVQAMRGPAAANEIRISARADLEAGAVVLRVADTGVGIPAVVLPRIFEPFFTTKPAGVGTGLGLFVCRSLVEGSGGRVDVRSRPGRGTTFTVTIPLALAAAEGAPTSAEAAPGPAPEAAPEAPPRPGVGSPGRELVPAA